MYVLLAIRIFNIYSSLGQRGKGEPSAIADGLYQLNIHPI